MLPIAGELLGWSLLRRAQGDKGRGTSGRPSLPHCRYARGLRTRTRVDPVRYAKSTEVEMATMGAAESRERTPHGESIERSCSPCRDVRALNDRLREFVGVSGNDAALAPLPAFPPPQPLRSTGHELGSAGQHPPAVAVEAQPVALRKLAACDAARRAAMSIASSLQPTRHTLPS